MSLKTEWRQQRQNRQKAIADLRHRIQTLLSLTQQERHYNGLELHKQLTTGRQALQADVQAYLFQAAQERQQQAQQSQSERQADMAALAAEMERLFSEFADFRLYLRTFCADLRQSVWGTSTSQPSVSSKRYQPTARRQPAKSVTTKPVAKPQPKTAVSRPAPQPPAQAVEVPLPVPTVTAPKPTAAPVNAPSSTAAVDKAKSSTPNATENSVYQYIAETPGARLSEIESNLRINRIQTVNALRSLVEKGMVAQRDRAYYTQQ